MDGTTTTAGALAPAKLLAGVRGWVFALANRYAARANLAVEDFAHELRVEIFLALPTFDPARGSFTGWVAWQARATLQRLTRARRRAVPAVPFSSLATEADGERFEHDFGRADPDAAAGRLERGEEDVRLVAAVRRALACLTPAQAAEVARYFGLRTRPRRPGKPSPKTVRQHVHAGVCSLATVPELADLAREYGIMPAAGGKARRRKLMAYSATGAGGVV